MHSNDWSRLLTERQREVLAIVVENKVYRNRDSKIPELAAVMGIAPAAVAKHLLEIEKTALLNVVVSPSEQGKRVYERLALEPRPEEKQTAEALDRNTLTVLRFIRGHPDASATEISEELGLSEYTTVNCLRVLTAVRLATKQRGPAIRRRERIRPRVERTSASGRMDCAARLGREVRRAKWKVVLHHPSPGLRARPRGVRPLARRRRRGRWRRTPHVDQGHRDLPSRRRMAGRGERRDNRYAHRHRRGRARKFRRAPSRSRSEP